MEDLGTITITGESALSLMIAAVVPVALGSKKRERRRGQEPHRLHAYCGVTTSGRTLDLASGVSRRHRCLVTYEDTARLRGAVVA